MAFENFDFSKEKTSLGVATMHKREESLSLLQKLQAESGLSFKQKQFEQAACAVVNSCKARPRASTCWGSHSNNSTVIFSADVSPMPGSFFKSEMSLEI